MDNELHVFFKVIIPNEVFALANVVANTTVHTYEFVMWLLCEAYAFSGEKIFIQSSDTLPPSFTYNMPRKAIDVFVPSQAMWAMWDAWEGEPILIAAIAKKLFSTLTEIVPYREVNLCANGSVATFDEGTVNVINTLRVFKDKYTVEESRATYAFVAGGSPYVGNARGVLPDVLFIHMALECIHSRLCCVSVVPTVMLAALYSDTYEKGMTDLEEISLNFSDHIEKIAVFAMENSFNYKYDADEGDEWLLKVADKCFGADTSKYCTTLGVRYPISANSIDSELKYGIFTKQLISELSVKFMQTYVDGMFLINGNTILTISQSWGRGHVHGETPDCASRVKLEHQRRGCA
jgi:hypothetical protein